MSFKGLNYGQLQLEGDSNKLVMTHRQHQLFALNYDSINNSTINKNDIIIETTADDLGN